MAFSWCSGLIYASLQEVYLAEFEPSAVQPLLSGMQLLDATRLLSWLQAGAAPLPTDREPPSQLISAVYECLAHDEALDDAEVAEAFSVAFKNLLAAIDVGLPDSGGR
jgi:hypothetical protein